MRTRTAIHKMFDVLFERPVAIGMFFLAISILGTFAWMRIPIELVPKIHGEQLFVQFYRPNGDPQLIEREILIPLESRIARLPDVTKTSATVNGNRGMLSVDYERGSNHKVRELELRRIAAELTRQSPPGTQIKVTNQDLSRLSHFVMNIQILGAADSNALRNFVEKQIQPKFESLPGVSQVMVYGGGAQELTIAVDTERCAVLGISPAQVSDALRRALRDLNYAGTLDVTTNRLAVILDGRPNGVESLGRVRVVPERPVLIEHVADIKIGPATPDSVSRVNGEPAVTLTLFQESGANLIDLGRQARSRIDDLRIETEKYGVELVISADAAQLVEDRLERLRGLALSGFLIALVVLYLFLQNLRAVAVVAVAVPISLLAAGSLLYLSGYTLNIITLFGLVIGVGMLVDNSTVVYEATQRNIERGLSAEEAASLGISATIRAICAASATNAVVFLPLLFVDDIEPQIRVVLSNIVPAVLFPLLASLLVAIFLVPLLAKYFAGKGGEIAHQAGESGKTSKPRLEQEKVPLFELFPALLKAALRKPAPWVTSLLAAVLLTTFIALPWIAVKSLGQSDGDSDRITVDLELQSGGSLEAAGLIFERLEIAALSMDVVERVESNFQEDRGTLTAHLIDREERATGVTSSSVRSELKRAIEGIDDVQLRAVPAGAGQGGATLDASASQIAVAGPEIEQLIEIAEELRTRLALNSFIEDTWLENETGSGELFVTPRPASLTQFEMTAVEALRPLAFIGREGERLELDYSLHNGDQIPIVVRRVLTEDLRVKSKVEGLTTVGGSGQIGLRELTESRRGEPPLAISHYNGRREVRVNYSLLDSAPATGPSRKRLEQEIDNIIHATQVPSGYVVQAVEDDQTLDFALLIMLPILLLIYAVLAMTFESVTLPFLILLTIPLTAIGAIWALFATGQGLDAMALVGVAVLLGLAINPAIILIDRMQQMKRSSHARSGSAAITAVRERVRPVLMTASTTIAGLWPLALANGEELEIWPPFATVVMGGLAASTMLTLIAIPIGFVVFSRLDRQLVKWRFWFIVAWFMATIAALTAAGYQGYLPELSTQIALFMLVATITFWWSKHRADINPIIDINDREVRVETRFLGKKYGQQFSRAWRHEQILPERINRSSATAGRQRLIQSALIGAGCAYLTYTSNALFWKVVFCYLAAFAVARSLAYAIRLLYLKRTPDGRRDPELTKTIRWVLSSAPWGALVVLVTWLWLVPVMQGRTILMPVIVPTLLLLATVIVQLGRHSARQSLNADSSSQDRSRLALWFSHQSQRIFSIGLEKPSFEALSSISFSANAGMIGVLGPNGAGKTTLLRMLTGIVQPSVGTIYFNQKDSRHSDVPISQYVGYLPQEFGLPKHLTGEQYLEYFALLYGMNDAAERHERIQKMLIDVGLESKRGEKISSYSGGMQQRLAIARALLSEPPVIVVDEPTVGLDPRERVRFRNLLARLAQKRVVLFSTHVVEDVEISCDRVLVLKRGALVYDGNPAQLAKHATGKIWGVKVSEEEAWGLENKVRVVHQTPMDDGRIKLRILSDQCPHEEAVQEPAGLEDGYMQLIYESATPLSSEDSSANYSNPVQALLPQEDETIKEPESPPSRWDKLVNRLRLIRLTYRWEYGRFTWLLPFVATLWPVFFVALTKFGWRSTGFDLNDAQNYLIGLPVYLMAIGIGSRLIAGEIDRRTMEVAYTIPGGALKIWSTKVVAAVLLLLSTIIVMTSVTAFFLTPVGMDVVFRIVSGTGFYLVLSVAVGIYFKNEITGGLAAFVLLALNLSMTESKWAPLYNPLSQSSATVHETLTGSIHNHTVVLCAALFITLFIVSRIKKPESLLNAAS